jgi:hypothetical protein
MQHRRYRFLSAAAALVLPGCSALTESDTRDEPALLRLEGREARVAGPDAVVAGTAFTLRIATLGGGCVREAARAEVRSVDGGSGMGTVRVRLLNRRTNSDVCSSDLREIEHVVTVPNTVGSGPPQPAQLLVLIEGANRGTETNDQTVPWVLQWRAVVRYPAAPAPAG